MFSSFRRSPSQSRKLSVEALETRDVPSTLLVDDDSKQFHNAPFTTISAAVAAAHPGDTILVARGTYAEQVVIPQDKDNLKIVLDPLTQPLSWILNGSLHAFGVIPWWVLIPALLLLVWLVSRAVGVTIFVAVSFIFIAFIVSIAVIRP